MAKYKLLLPKMGESVAEATVIRWTKNPGDHIEADETVMEIATDKVDSDVPSPVTGKLVEQLYKDNDVVQVGAVIAIIETNEPEEIAPSPIASPVQQPVAEKPPVVNQTPPPAAIVQQPVVSETRASYQEQRAPVQDVEKQVAVEVAPAPVQQPGETPEVKPLVFAEHREEQVPPVPYTGQLSQKSATSEEEAKNSLRFYSPLVKNIAAQENITNAELDNIPGTGAEGRLTKDDLLNYIQNRYQPDSNAAPVAETPKTPEVQHTFSEPQKTDIKGPETVIETPQPAVVTETPVQPQVIETPGPDPVVDAPEPAPIVEEPKPQPAPEKPKPEPVSSGTSMSGGDEIIEMDRMRRLIADHMVMSKHTSPHVTSFVEADVTNLVLWRDKIKNAFEKREGEKITFTPIFIEAVVRAIKDLPMINIQVNGTQIIKKKDINISMATALPSGNLIVPVIKKADELSLIGLTKAVNDLANRARNNKLKPDDVQGGTFTITNVGSFGNVMGTPIINQPQVAILAVGAIRKKPAVIETLQGDMIGIRHMMFLSLSYDHRVVDGALGGTFVKRVSDYLENWDPGREI
jgi:2-oxoglutarate dehydrogenase E2 component (dihydrolipoamide succinyltransferase)